jgi:uncharacterized membrane protein
MQILKKHRWPLWLILGLLLFSLLGFIDAGYLTVTHIRHEIPTCNIYAGCDQVTGSKYSAIGGVPLALLGALYYLFIFVLALIYFDSESRLVKYWLPYVTIAGFAVSLYLVYLQLFVIQAICIYCMGSAITSTLIFILGMIGLKYNR